MTPGKLDPLPPWVCPGGLLEVRAQNTVPVPGMSFTVVKCLRMTGPCLKVLGLVVGWGSHLGEGGKDERRGAVGLADVGQSRDTHRAASAPHSPSASLVFPAIICLSLQVPQLLLLLPPFPVMPVPLPPPSMPRHHPGGQILPLWLSSHAGSCPLVTIHVSCPALPPPRARTWRPECQCRNR